MKWNCELSDLASKITLCPQTAESYNRLPEKVSHLRGFSGKASPNHLSEVGRNPIRFRLTGSGDMICRMASNTTLNWRSYLLSSSSRRHDNSVLAASIRRSLTKV